MWGKNAICVACGAYKRRAWQRCKHCGREPASDYELARALILSLKLSLKGDIIAVGRSEAELKRIGDDIRSGRPYLFDPAEEQKALNSVQTLRELEQKKRRRLQLIRLGVVAAVLVLAYFLWRSGK